MMTRRAAVLAAPALVPLSMAAVFGLLARRLPPRRAYNVGFGIYWLGWCLAFPVWVLGRRRAATVLLSGRRPTVGEAVVLAVPVLGAAATALVPYRRDIDPGVAVVMVVSAAVNAVGEELLWRGVFLEEFPTIRCGAACGRWQASRSGTWHRRSCCRRGWAESDSFSAPPWWAPRRRWRRGAAPDCAPPCCRTWPPTRAGLWRRASDWDGDRRPATEAIWLQLT